MTKRIVMMMLSTIMFFGLTTMAARLAVAQSQSGQMGSQDSGKMAGDTPSEKMGSQDNGNMAGGTTSQDKMAGEKTAGKTAKTMKKASKRDKMSADAKTSDKGKMDDSSNKMDDSTKMGDQK